MANKPFELNKEGVRALLRSEQTKAMCEKRAHSVCKRCGSGYSVTTFTGRNRANASVYAETATAKRDALDNNTLLKALK